MQALWTDEHVARLPLFNRAEYDKATNYGAKSDILRYELLYVYGGVYVDCDMQCIGSFERLHQVPMRACAPAGGTATGLAARCGGSARWLLRDRRATSTWACPIPVS